MEKSPFSFPLYFVATVLAIIRVSLLNQISTQKKSVNIRGSAWDYEEKVRIKELKTYNTYLYYIYTH